MPIELKEDFSFTNLLQKNLANRYKFKERTNLHISDLTICLRKTYYSRKYPEMNVLTNESVFHFIRGQASENVITELARIGVAQVNIEKFGIKAHPDLMLRKKDLESISPTTELDLSKEIGENVYNSSISKENELVIIELKDTTSGQRMTIEDITFKAYLRQLLYYLVLTDLTSGILSIQYNIKELNWYKRDKEGDHFLRPHNAKDVGIESFTVFLPSLEDDPLSAREVLTEEIIERKELLENALDNNQVKNLSRLQGKAKILSCKRCPYYTKCWDEDNETLDAMKRGARKDILDDLIQIESKNMNPREEIIIEESV